MRLIQPMLNHSAPVAVHDNATMQSGCTEDLSGLSNTIAMNERPRNVGILAMEVYLPGQKVRLMSTSLPIDILVP